MSCQVIVATSSIVAEVSLCKGETALCDVDCYRMSCFFDTSTESSVSLRNTMHDVDPCLSFRAGEHDWLHQSASLLHVSSSALGINATAGPVSVIGVEGGLTQICGIDTH